MCVTTARLVYTIHSGVSHYPTVHSNVSLKTLQGPSPWRRRLLLCGFRWAKRFRSILELQTYRLGLTNCLFDESVAIFDFEKMIAVPHETWSVESSRKWDYEWSGLERVSSAACYIDPKFLQIRSKREWLVWPTDRWSRSITLQMISCEETLLKTFHSKKFPSCDSYHL